MKIWTIRRWEPEGPVTFEEHYQQTLDAAALYATDADGDINTFGVNFAGTVPAAPQPKTSFIETAETRAENVEKYNIVPENSGLAHTTVQEPVVNFNPAPQQLEINSQNASIVFGTDRPAGLADGHGAAGAQGANTIDIVVGRMSKARGGLGAEDGSVVENSFCADGARIYISEMTDVDKNFGLAGTAALDGTSAIGIKADNVRVIGTSGVKIVTGRSFACRGFGNSGESNTLGGHPGVAQPIELIAGNNTEPSQIAGASRQGESLQKGLKSPETIERLQPISMGLNTRDALRDLGTLVEEILGTLFNMAILQTTFNSVLGVTPIYAHSVAASTVATQYMSKVINPLWQTRANKVAWHINHLETYGYKYICSKNVFAT
jgi:hypothetical protein